jgi:cell fate regulator YaaT (PSP1 superfamily)
MSQAELESEDSGRFPAERPSERYVVRYGLMRLVAEFAARGPQKFSRSAAVIVRSSRGLEWGEVLCQATERTAEYLESQESIGKILRQANDEDARQRDEVYQQERTEFLGCRKMIGERKLGMQLVDVEHLLGGERLIFYYLAEQRVDFRDLVKALANRYNKRIEMR